MSHTQETIRKELETKYPDLDHFLFTELQTFLVKEGYSGEYAEMKYEEFGHFVLNLLLHEHNETVAICRKIYMEGADWAEWGMSDEEAGKKFDDVLSTLLAMKKENE